MTDEMKQQPSSLFVAICRFDHSAWKWFNWFEETKRTMKTLEQKEKKNRKITMNCPYANRIVLEQKTFGEEVAQNQQTHIIDGHCINSHELTFDVVQSFAFVCEYIYSTGSRSTKCSLWKCSQLFGCSVARSMDISFVTNTVIEYATHKCTQQEDFVMGLKK